MACKSDLDGPHWAFSLAVYGTVGVERACLLLQERYGVDVNVLLLALFAACCRGAAPDGDGIALLDAAGKPLRAGVVVPLRMVRRYLKGAPYGEDGNALRELVKKQELQAEQLEQSILAGTVAGFAPRKASPLTVAQAVVSFYAAASEHDYAVDVLASDAEAQHAIATIAEAAGDFAAGS